MIHSFIHIEHLYSASSRKLLRSAPNTSTVKQSSHRCHSYSSKLNFVIAPTLILCPSSVAGTEVNWQESMILLHSTGWQTATDFECQTHSQLHSAAQRKSNSYHLDSTHKTIRVLSIHTWRLSTHTNQAVDELKMSECRKHRLSPALMNNSGINKGIT